MSVVPGFAHDVFISYAHVDNVPLEEDIGWVSRFQKHLKILLAQKIGREEKISIWRDESLQGNHVFGEEIRKRIESSAVFLCVLSDGYRASDWCQREIEAFCSQKNGRFNLRVGQRSRLMKVELAALEPRPGAAELEVSLGYRFYDPQPKYGWSPELRPTRPEDPDQRYWNRMKTLANQVADLLKEMARSVDPVGDGPKDAPLLDERLEPVPPRPVPPGTTVYLAETADELADERELLRRELEDRGVRVLPAETLPNRASELEPIAMEALRAAQFSVHMFAGVYGKPLVGSPRSLSHIQYELASRVAKEEGGGLRRLVWIPQMHVKAEMLPPVQRSLFEDIRNEGDEGVPPELLENHKLEDLENYILDAIKRLNTTAALPPAGSMVFIAGRKGDFNDPHTTAMIDYLASRYDVIKSAQDRELHENTNIRYCDGLMILYGHPEHKEWAESKAVQAKALTKRRRKRALVLAIYDGPPETKEDLGVVLKDVFIVCCRRGFSPNSLDSFVDQLARRAGRIA